MANCTNTVYVLELLRKESCPSSGASRGEPSGTELLSGTLFVQPRSCGRVQPTEEQKRGNDMDSLVLHLRT